MAKFHADLFLAAIGKRSGFVHSGLTDFCLATACLYENLHEYPVPLQRIAREQAKAAILDWMAFNHHARLHSAPGCLSPMQYEQRWLAAQRKNAA